MNNKYKITIEAPLIRTGMKIETECSERYVKPVIDKLMEIVREVNGVSRSLPSDYDIGLIGDYGGGNVEWWQDYLREEVARCNNYWVSQLQNED